MGKVREARIGLEEQHDTGELLAVGQVETVTQPGQDHRVAGEIRGGLRWSAPVVVAAGQIERDEEDGTKAKARMFGVASGLTRQGSCVLPSENSSSQNRRRNFPRRSSGS
jgi:hypothetical protein